MTNAHTRCSAGRTGGATSASGESPTHRQSPQHRDTEGAMTAVRGRDTMNSTTDTQDKVSTVAGKTGNAARRKNGRQN